MSRDPYRDPYRSSAGDLGRSERWDRDRFYSERDRDRDRYSDLRDGDDHVYTRPPDRRPEPPLRRAYDDDVIRDRRYYYDDEPRYARRSPPPHVSEVDRKVVIDRERAYSPSPPPRRPPVLLRRQSSLDTFDRRPRGYHEREEYGPPARRDDFRAPPYVDIPLPRTKALPPPRHVDYHDDIRVDEDLRPYPDRVREREFVRTRRRRDRSRESRATRSHARGSSGSSSRSSSSSSTGGGTSIKSEYPKKGKTRIPERLVSKRALIDLNYPFVEEGNTIIVQKALGQENIDDLLKLSEDYKKSDLELAANRSHAGDIIEEHRREVYVAPPAAAPAPPVVVPPRSPAPPQVEVVDRTYLRSVSPTLTSRSSRSRSVSTASHAPLVVDARPREVSTEIAVGPLALIESRDGHHHHHHHHHRHHRHRSSSLSGRGELVRAEKLPTGELVLYQEEVEKVEQPSRGVRIEKDKKGPPPQLMRAMLATLT